MIQSDFVDRIIGKYIKDEELRQLLISHSRMVAEKALKIAAETGVCGRIDPQFVCDAAMLHDIGVVRCDASGIGCHGRLPYICHGIAGAAILRSEGLDERYCRVCERHTGAGISADDIEEQNLPLPKGDYLPETLEEKLICFADKFYSKSGDPLAEKPMERVEASMKRHGDAAFARFVVLRDLFKSCGK